jgi:hypothetical protein
MSSFSNHISFNSLGRLTFLKNLNFSFCLFLSDVCAVPPAESHSPPTGFLQCTAFFFKLLLHSPLIIYLSTRLIHIAAIVFSLAVAGGCAPNISGDWSPLAIGMRFQYRETAYPVDAEPVTGSILYEVSKPYELENSFSVDRRDSRAPDRRGMEVWGKTIDEDGYSFWILSPPPWRCPLVIPPPKDGWAWFGETRSPLCLFNGMRDVAVPAGEFKGCILVTVEAPGDPVTRRYWFARGVGMVRYAEYLSGRAMYVMELEAAAPAR